MRVCEQSVYSSLNTKLLQDVQLICAVCSHRSEVKLVSCWKVYTGSLVTFIAAKSAETKSCVSSPLAMHVMQQTLVNLQSVQPRLLERKVTHCASLNATLGRLTIAGTRRDFAKISHKDR